MLHLIALQSGKQVWGASSAIMSGSDCPCPATSGDYGYLPAFYEFAVKGNEGNSQNTHAFFAECQELSGVQPI